MERMGGEIVAIWIKRAHRSPLDGVKEAELVKGGGIVGNADQGGWRQITIIEEGAWKDAERELGAEVDPSGRRANVMVRGIDLKNTRGKKLRLGDCVVNIRGQNPPCTLMNEAHQGLQKALEPQWRAGIFGDIVQGGTIRVGDPVSFEL